MPNAAVKRAAAPRRRAAQAQRTRRAIVVSYSPQARARPHGHESVTRAALARRLAHLQGCEFGGEYDVAGAYDAPLYFVPDATLLETAARALGIRGEADLFGGVVPHEFVATKAITHPTMTPQARVPPGWSPSFARAVAKAVLPGYSAFSREDAARCGERLLEAGAVRVKPALALGGRGQVIAADREALEAAVAAIPADALTRCGVVLEPNLEAVTTYSVGQVRVGDLTASYCGTQKLARNHRGEAVYGGSDLTVARGDFAALLALDLDAAARLAIEQARVYDAAARRCFAGFFASRCNYDIVRGHDAGGTLRSGVLEQSWRIGGASGAEVAALEAFRAEPALRAVRAECTEVYDPEVQPPSEATVYFRGLDPEVGYITKYTTLAPYVDA